MNNIKSVIALAAASILAAGCAHDLNMNMVPDSIGFPGKDVVIEVSLYNESYTGSIIKNGKGSEAAVVKLCECTAEEVAAVDTNHYNLVSPLSYTISERAFNFKADEVRKTFEISWDKDAMFQDLKGKESVIAVKLYDSNIGIQENRSIILIKPVVSTVGIKSKDALAASELCIRNIYPEAEYISRIDEGFTTMEIDLPVPGRDIEANLAFDNSLIPEINAALGSEFVEAPAGLVTLESSSIVLPAGSTGVDIKYSINYSKLFNAEGEFAYKEDLVIPIAISSIEPSTLYISNRYAYFIFNMSAIDIVKPPVGVDPVRLIGPGWTVLEGDEHSMNGDPNIESDWYLGRYGADHLVDGSFLWPDGAFCTWYWTYPEFPISFVFDTGEEHIWDKFYKVDSNSYQGQLQDFEVWVAREYLGDKTEWVLAAQGNTGTNGWQAFNVDKIENFTYVIPFVAYTRGRYVKFVITKCSGAYAAEGGYAGGGGYLSEFYGQGW